MELWINDLLLFSSWLAYIISIGFLLKFKNWSSDKYVRALFGLLGISLITDVVCFIVANYGIHTTPFQFVYIILSSIITLNIYRIHFKKTKIFILLIIIFELFTIYTLLIHDGLIGGINLPYLFLIIIVLAMSVAYFYRLFKKMDIPLLTDNFFFWMNSAFMVYFGTTLFLYLFENVLTDPSMGIYLYTWPIQIVATIIFNCILIRGIWVTRRI